MSTTGASDPLAEDAAVVREEAVIHVTLLVQQSPKNFGSTVSYDYHTWSTAMSGFVLPGDVLEGMFDGLVKILDGEIDKFAKPHPREQHQLDPSRDPSGQVGQRGPDNRGIDGTDAG